MIVCTPASHFSPTLLTVFPYVKRVLLAPKSFQHTACHYLTCLRILSFYGVFQCSEAKWRQSSRRDKIFLNSNLWNELCTNFYAYFSKNHCFFVSIFHFSVEMSMPLGRGICTVDPYWEPAKGLKLENESESSTDVTTLSPSPLSQRLSLKSRTKLNSAVFTIKWTPTSVKKF